MLVKNGDDNGDKRKNNGLKIWVVEIIGFSD